MCLWCRNTQFPMKSSWIQFEIMKYWGLSWTFRQGRPSWPWLDYYVFSICSTFSKVFCLICVFQNMLGKARPKSLQLGESRLTLLQQAMPLSPPPITPKTPRTQSKLCSWFPFKQNLWDWGGGGLLIALTQFQDTVLYHENFRKVLPSCILKNGVGIVWELMVMADWQDPSMVKSGKLCLLSPYCKHLWSSMNRLTTSELQRFFGTVKLLFALKCLEGPAGPSCMPPPKLSSKKLLIHSFSSTTAFYNSTAQGYGPSQLERQWFVWLIAWICKEAFMGENISKILFWKGITNYLEINWFKNE